MVWYVSTGRGMTLAYSLKRLYLPLEQYPGQPGYCSSGEEIDWERFDFSTGEYLGAANH